MHNPLLSDLPEETKIWLDKLNRLGIDSVEPLVLIFLRHESNDAKRVRFLQAVERYLFTVVLGGYFRGYPYQYEIHPRVLKWAIDFSNDRRSGENVTRAISEATNTQLKEPAFLKQVANRFRSDGFYNWHGIRYFLFEYNLDLQSRSKTERPKILWPEFTEQKSDFISVEHIYPQKARDEYWRARFGGMTAKQRTALKNSLGNLLPLSKAKNSSLSNRPFREKCEGRGDPVGYCYGCYAENEVATEEEWTPSRILTRGLWMLRFMEKRWSLELGPEDQKKTMLGLDFLG